MADNGKTVRDVLKPSTEFLARHGTEQPQLIVEMLLSRLLKRPRLELAMDYGRLLPEPYLEAMRRGLKRVAGGEPVQYVLGETGFMNQVFKTDRRALIPRPETEVLVRLVLECNALWQRERPAIADVGTGSGCIVLSLAAARPQGRYLALDVSEDALALARENAELLGLADRVIFAGEGLSDVIEAESLDAITANLPYIPTAALEHLPANVRDHEPRMALDGGASGLDVITTVIEDAAIALRSNGMLFLEIGEGQGKSVSGLMRNAGFDEVQVHPDLNRRDRVVAGRLAM
jgi:release factor glutamine methyltransferase